MTAAAPCWRALLACGRAPHVRVSSLHGPGIDQPLVRYDGSGTTNKQSLHADERGSITALTYGSPYAPTINRYDEYGKPQPGNIGRFQYTGQMWLSEAGLYHYKARAYSPTFGGRFLQTDPIGYEGGINLYAYVGNDPVNWADPLGLTECEDPTPDGCGTIVVIADPVGTGLPQRSTSVTIVVRGKRKGLLQARLTQCQIAFFANELAKKGLPTEHLGAVTFVSGLDSNANELTRSAFPNAKAVTQSNTIYVQPEFFSEISTFGSRTGFEEVAHTSQFALEGRSQFYATYAITSLGGIISGLGGYQGNVQEAFAKGLATALQAAYQHSNC